MGAKSAQRSQAAAQEQADPQQAAAAPAPEETAAAPAELDDAAEIQKWADLKDQGVLTEEEFAAKKKQILGI